MKPPMKKPTPPTKKREAPKKTPAPMPGAMHSAEDMKYKAQDALHTLRRAEEIKADPHLMGHVKAHARDQRDHLNKVIRRK
jgi:hypothetical protein